MAQVPRKPTFPDHIIKKIISKFQREVEEEVYPVSTGIYTQQKLVNLWQAIPKPLLADYDDKIFFEIIQNSGICNLTSCPNCLIDFTNKEKPISCHFCNKWYCEECICHRKRLHPMDNNPNGPRYTICYDCDGKYLLLQLNHSYVQNRMLIQLAIVEISKDLEQIQQKLEYQNKRIRSSRSEPKTKLNMKQSIMKKQELDLKKHIKKNQWELENQKDKRAKLQVKLRELRIQQRKSIIISEQQKQQRLIRLKKMQEEEEQRKKRQKQFYSELEKQKSKEREQLEKQIQLQRVLEQLERQKQMQRQIQLQRQREIQRQKERQLQIKRQLEKQRQRQIYLQKQREQQRIKLMKQQQQQRRIEQQIQKKRQIQKQKQLQQQRQLQKLQEERQREKQRFRQLERMRQAEKEKEKQKEKQKERLRKIQLQKQRERERIQQQKRLQRQKEEEKQKQQKNGKELEVTFQTHRNQTEGTVQNSHRNSYLYNQFKNYFTQDMRSEVSRSQSEISINTQKNTVPQIDKKQKEVLFNQLKKKLEQSQKKDIQTQQIDYIKAQLLRSAAKKQKYWESNKQEQTQQFVAPAQKCKCTLF